jgi:hypothetical protein
MTPQMLLSRCAHCDNETDDWIELLTTINVYERPSITFTEDGEADQFDIRLDEDWSSQETQEIRCFYCLEELTDEQRKAYEEMVS